MAGHSRESFQPTSLLLFLLVLKTSGMTLAVLLPGSLSKAAIRDSSSKCVHIEDKSQCKTLIKTLGLFNAIPREAVN